MTKELAVTNGNYVARYGGAADPFAAFANEGGPGIQGQLLLCRQGEWTIGADNAHVPEGTRFLMLVPTVMRGYLKWEDGRVVDGRMGLVAENYLMPHVCSLPDRDESTWQKDPSGKLRDPWTPCFRALLVELSPPHGDVTFSSSAWGAEKALKEICGLYSANGQTGTYPVVELATK